MTANLPAEVEKTEYGPAMTALTNPKFRAFVLAYCTNGANATEAAIAAGYRDGGGIRVTAHRMLHDPRIKAAIRETVITMTASNLPVYKEALEKVALNAQHKDQVKALFGLLDRGGMPAIQERNVNINVTLTREEKIAEIKQMAEVLGVDPAALIGNVSDAEFEEIPHGMEDVW